MDTCYVSGISNLQTEFRTVKCCMKSIIEERFARTLIMVTFCFPLVVVMLIEIRSGEKACDTFSVYVKKKIKKKLRRDYFFPPLKSVASHKFLYEMTQNLENNFIKPQSVFKLVSLDISHII